MITEYGIILEDNILYCSNESKYTAFEIVLFVEKLISSINPKKTWRLNSISLEGHRLEEECMVIKHMITKNNENLFYCIIGYFLGQSSNAFNMLEEFFEKVSYYYITVDILKEASKKPIFKEIIEIATDYLWDKYEELLEVELQQESDTSINNKILYCGISTKGLPIISQLYDKTLLYYLDKEINDMNIELFISELSAKLATIVMNAIIRAKARIREIIIDDLEDKKSKKVIFVGDINDYSIDFFASGSYYRLKEVFKKLKKRISKERVLHEKFLGDLRPYIPLQKYLNEIINEFDQKG